MKGLSFLVNNEYFVVDVNLVYKVTRKMMVTPVISAPEEIIGIANLKGRVITILCLSKLLGNKENLNFNRGSNAIKAVVFKSLFDSEDQIGLMIDEPGYLIDINDNSIRVPSLPTGAKDSFCISGVAEVDFKLYRIINIDSIINKYKGKGDKTPEVFLNGGFENDQKN